jgi:hypothetical protein
MALEGVYCHQVSSEKCSQAVLYQSHAADGMTLPGTCLLTILMLWHEVPF